MKLERVVSYQLAGPVDQPTLDRLRNELALRAHGRFTDDWDQIFGSATVEVEGGAVGILLIRDDIRPGWNIDLSVAGEPSTAALQHLESDVLSATTACGLSVLKVFRRTLGADGTWRSSFEDR